MLYCTNSDTLSIGGKVARRTMPRSSELDLKTFRRVSRIKLVSCKRARLMLGC